MFKLCVLSGLLAVSAFGADVTGIWTGSLTDRNGDPQDFSFRFTQKGDTLTGKMYGDNESTPIAAAKVAGNQITFSVTTELNGQVSTSIYTGMVNGDLMEVSRARADSKKDDKPQTFRLKRLT